MEESVDKDSPSSSKIRVSWYLPELLNSTLSLIIQKDALLQPSLPSDFCAQLLQDQDKNPTACICHGESVPATGHGVQIHPLYKQLARKLNGILSCTFTSENKILPGMAEDQSCETLDLNFEKWSKHILTFGSQLGMVLEKAQFHIDVQEPYFTHLRYGRKRVEGRCAFGKYKRIIAGDFLLVNKCLLLLVEAVKWYGSFLEMIESEKIENVLPGIKTLEEGVQVYRMFYSEEREKEGGVLAIHVSRAAVQPYISMSEMLRDLGVNGIKEILK